MWIKITGSAGFLLCLLYDINSITRDRKMLRKCFFAGLFLIFCATTGIFIRDWNAVDLCSGKTILFVAAGIFFAAALMYALFFALPFQDTYMNPDQRRRVCSEGIYALCRHPGLLCFTALYACIAGIVGTENAFYDCLFLTAWDAAYVIFQDMVVFPKTFVDYDGYRKMTPFLIPNRKSWKRCAATWRKEGEKIES